MGGICPECNIHYERLGRHWTGDCQPTISPIVEDVIDGLVMGDASILSRDSTPYLQINMKADSMPYLEHLDRGFGPLSAKVWCDDEAHLRTHAHPAFKQWAEWYKTGHKVFPDNLELSPLTAKHWYAGDGGLVSGHNQIQFYTRNERERLDWLAELFENKGFETRTENCKNTSARVILKDGKGALDWMGDPLPAFHHKWDL